MKINDKILSNLGEGLPEGLFKKAVRKLLRIRLFSQEIRELWFVADRKTFFDFVWGLLVTTPANIKNLNVNAAFDRMIGKKCVFNASAWGRPDVKIILDGKWLGYAMSSYVRPDYFLSPHFVLQPGMTVVDLGAAGGDFTLLAALICDRVVAVEAKADSVRELKENAKLNNVSEKIAVVHAILAPGSGLIAKGDKAFMNYLRDNPAPVISMNELFLQHNLSRVDFLKMDIEGSEFDLVSRDTQWLYKVDKIAAEMDSHFGDIDWFCNVLKEHGFEVTLVVDKNKSTVHGIGKELLYARRT